MILLFFFELHTAIASIAIAKNRRRIGRMFDDLKRHPEKIPPPLRGQ